jgi:AcrR family transcriptional regulator
MSVTHSSSANLGADDWVEAAFDAMAEGGIDAVRIEPLAKQLGVTRGSFYWHFADRDRLYLAMLRKWRERASYMVYARMEREAEPAGVRLERLLALPYSSPRSTRAAAIELSVRLWARRDRRAARVVKLIDRVRIDYFQKLMRQHGLSEEESRKRAFLFYAALMAEALIVVEDREQTSRDLQDVLLGS